MALFFQALFTMFELAESELFREYTVHCGKLVRGKPDIEMREEKYFILSSTRKIFLKLFIHASKISSINELGFDNAKRLSCRYGHCQVLK